MSKRRLATAKCMRKGTRPSRATGLSGLLHAEAEGEPRHSRYNQVDAQENTQDVEARDWPARENDKSEEKRDQAGK